MCEEWRGIPGYEGLYEVSNIGRLRTIKTGKIKKQRTSRYGYLIVGLSKDGWVRTMMVHRAVLMAFVGMPPPGHEAHHKNHLKTSNPVENLEWVTPKENVRAAIEEGLHNNTGHHNGNAKLTEDQVRSIRHSYAAHGETKASIARRFGIGHTTVRNIINRDRWAHVE